jgi:hypothetical protein
MRGSRRRVGVCAALALAIVGIGATSAQAKVQIGRCVMVLGHTGHYTNEFCSKSVVSGGEWEFLYGAEKYGFTGSATEAVFESAGGTKVACGAVTVAGKYLHATNNQITSAEDIRTYTGCSFVPTGSECHLVGRAPGEFVMGGSGPIAAAEGGVGHQVGMATTTLVCGTTKVKIGQGTGKGGKCTVGLIGPVQLMSSTFVEKLTGSGGNQYPQELTRHKCNLEMEVGRAAWERASLTSEITITNEEPLLIKYP